MRKIYFLAFALFGLALNAQTVIDDDFESYPLGPYFGEHWSNWSGASSSGENIEISNAYAQSGSQSGFIGSGGTQDAILKLGNRFTGTWTFQHSLYIPSGFTGYYNFQEDENTTTGIWGVEVFLGIPLPDLFPDNNSYLRGTDESTAYGLAGFDIPFDTWFTMKWVYDMDEGTVVVTLDGTEIYSGESFLESFQLGGVDYYSYNEESTNQMYIDDVLFVEGELAGVSDMDMTSISVYPTVVNDSFNVSAKSNISEIAVFNTVGQQVMRVAPQNNSAQVNVNSLPSGVYVVKIMAGKEVKTSKIVVK